MKTSITKCIQILYCFAGIFICVSFNSCIPLYYAPNTNNVPLFKEKGEGRINVAYSGADEIEGGEIQGALALSDKIGIMLNTSFMGASEDDLSGSGYLVEGGAGYYKSVAKNFVFEAYGGLGFGGAKNEYYNGGSSNVNFIKFFVQPDIGFTVKNFDFGIASKFSAATFNIANGPETEYGLAYIKENPTSLLWEPSFFVRFGFRSVKIQLGQTWSVNLNNKDLAQEVYMGTIGLSFNIKPKKK